MEDLEKSKVTALTMARWLRVETASAVGDSQKEDPLTVYDNCRIEADASWACAMKASTKEQYDAHIGDYKKWDNRLDNLPEEIGRTELDELKKPLWPIYAAIDETFLAKEKS